MSFTVFMVSSKGRWAHFNVKLHFLNQTIIEGDMTQKLKQGHFLLLHIFKIVHLNLALKLYIPPSPQNPFGNRLFNDKNPKGA